MLPRNLLTTPMYINYATLLRRYQRSTQWALTKHQRHEPHAQPRDPGAGGRGPLISTITKSIVANEGMYLVFFTLMLLTRHLTVQLLGNTHTPHEQDHMC